MRVLIVDSSIQITERLEEILSESENIAAIYKSVSYAEAANLFKQHSPQVVLLDIYLPGNDSILLLKEIKKTGGSPLIIILSVQTGNYMHDQFRSLGADFFFDKYHDFEKIPGFINSVGTTRNA